MRVIEVCFWSLFISLLYIYWGYPLLLGLLSFFLRARTVAGEENQLMTSLIIAVYNEEAVIGEKIENSLELDYPRENLEIIVVSDASTDRTDEIVKSYERRGVKLTRIEGRKGKTYCQNKAVEIAKGEIVIFSDSNSMYEPDALKRLVRHFADPKVGCVVGELRYRRGAQGVEGERCYWRYEQLLKRLETRVSSLVGANGAIYAIRRDLFEPLGEDAISDFVEPLKIVQKGCRVVYEPGAVAWEETAPNPEKEFRRRVRIVARSVSSLLRDRSLHNLLNPRRYGFFAVQLWSHKILRWFSGVFIVLTFALNLPILGHDVLYTVILAGQVVFYLLALWGVAYEKVLNRRAPKLARIAYYFCLSCYAMLKGVIQAIRGYTIVTWEPIR